MGRDLFGLLITWRNFKIIMKVVLVLGFIYGAMACFGGSAEAKEGPKVTKKVSLVHIKAFNLFPTPVLSFIPGLVRHQH